MHNYAIQTEGLTFHYSKQRKALDDVSLNIPKGSIYGFLGPNGAGKSTTMRLLTGILPEQEKSIRIFGDPLHSQLPGIFHRIGSLVESPSLYLHLTGYDNLRYIAKMRKLPESRIPEVLQLVDLHRDSKRKAKNYSLGMKQRLAIAMTLLNDPELLLLDEPVNGLDPNGMRDIRQLLVKLNKEKGVTIFISSHLLAEVERMCTHVGIISRGKMRFEGTIGDLSKASGSCNVQLTVKDASEWHQKLSVSYTGVKRESENQLILELPNRESVPAFTRELVNSGADIYELKVLNGLEEWFMKLINQQ